MSKFDIGNLFGKSAGRNLDQSGQSDMARNLAVLDVSKPDWYLGVTAEARKSLKSLEVGRAVYGVVLNGGSVRGVIAEAGLDDNTYPWGGVTVARDRDTLRQSIYDTCVTHGLDRFTPFSGDRRNPTEVTRARGERDAFTKRQVEATALAMGVVDKALELDGDENTFFGFYVARILGFLHDPDVAEKVKRRVAESGRSAINIYYALISETRESEGPQVKLVEELKELTREAYEAEQERLAEERVALERQRKIDKWEAERERLWDIAWNGGRNAGVKVTGYGQTMVGNRWVQNERPGSADFVRMELVGGGIVPQENPQIVKGPWIRTPERLLEVVGRVINGLADPESDESTGFRLLAKVRSLEGEQLEKVQYLLIDGARAYAAGFARAVMDRVLEPDLFSRDDRRLKEMRERELGWVTEALGLSSPDGFGDERVADAIKPFIEKLDKNQQEILKGKIVAYQARLKE